MYDWIKNHFTATTEEADTTCQEPLEIRYGEKSKHKFDNGEYENLWQNKQRTLSYIQICRKYLVY